MSRVEGIKGRTEPQFRESRKPHLMSIHDYNESREKSYQPENDSLALNAGADLERG